MMQHHTFSTAINTSYNGAVRTNDSSRIRKRKLSFPASFDTDDIMIPQKKAKQMENFFDDIPTLESDFSILDLPEVSVPLSDKDDVFDWMENILFDKNLETASAESNDRKNSEIASFLTPGEPENISVFPEDQSNGKSDENVFKAIHESFISDRLIGHNFLPTADYSKRSTLRRSSSFSSRLGRSSRIGIRQGLAKLAKANSRSAKTRQMLLNCKLSVDTNNSQ